jgi:hypothetical protein
MASQFETQSRWGRNRQILLKSSFMLALPAITILITEVVWMLLGKGKAVIWKFSGVLHQKINAWPRLRFLFLDEILKIWDLHMPTQEHCYLPNYMASHAKMTLLLNAKWISEIIQHLIPWHIATIINITTTFSYYNSALLLRRINSYHTTIN